MKGKKSHFERETRETTYGPGEDAERVAEKLIEGAEHFGEVSGANYWLAKLYRALAGNDNFCDGGFEAVRVQVQAH
jgi:hypothetical protein